MENSSVADNFPVAKVANSFLKDNLQSSPFSFPDWNKGRIVSQHSHLKRLLSEKEQLSGDFETDGLISLTNTPLPLPPSRTSISAVRREKVNSTDKDNTARQKELMPSTV